MSSSILTLRPPEVATALDVLEHLNSASDRPSDEVEISGASAPPRENSISASYESQIGKTSNTTAAEQSSKLRTARRVGSRAVFSTTLSWKGGSNQLKKTAATTDAKNAGSSPVSIGQRPLPKRNKTLGTALDVSDLVLTTLRNAGTLTKAPFVKDASNLALGIVNTVQAVRDNKFDWSRIARDAAQLVAVIVCQYVQAEKNARPMPPETDAHLKQLLQKLREIDAAATENTNRSMLKRIVGYKADTRGIHNLREDLAQSMSVFGVQQFMTNADGFGMLLEDMRQVKEMIEQLSRRMKAAPSSPVKKATTDPESPSKSESQPEVGPSARYTSLPEHTAVPESSTPSPIAHTPVRPSVQIQPDSRNPFADSFDSQTVYASPTSLRADSPRSSTDATPTPEPHFDPNHTEIPLPRGTRARTTPPFQSSPHHDRTHSNTRRGSIFRQEQVSPRASSFMHATSTPPAPPAPAYTAFDLSGAVFRGSITQNSIQGDQVLNTTTRNSNPVNSYNTTTITTRNSFNTS